jgi:stage II sporulation protein D
MKVRIIIIAIALLIATGVHAQNTIRIGVLGLFHPHVLQVSWTGPETIVISGAGDAVLLDGEAGHQELTVHAKDGQVLVGGRPVQKLSGSARAGGDMAFELIVPGRFHRRYKGRLEIIARGGELVPVVLIEREAAVATIVASEMPGNSPTEALKAQAVVTRSFLSAGPRHKDFDFCDTTHCQYFRSPMEVRPRVWAAVRATEGVILTWHERPIAALYSSRCGGRTRSLREAGIDPGEDYPYYSVVCRWCQAHPLQSTQQAGYIHDPKVQWGGSALHGEAGTERSDEDELRERSFGHGIGMCQYGAAGMAREGADFRSILLHYYPNATLFSSR